MNKTLVTSTSAIFIYLLGTGFFYISLLKVLGSYGVGIFIALISYGNFFGQITTFGLDNQYLLTTLDSKTNNIYIFLSYFKRIIIPIIINIFIAIICGIFIFNFKNISSLFLISVMIIYIPLSQLIQSQFISSNNTFSRVLWFSSQPWIKSLGFIFILFFNKESIYNFDQVIVSAKLKTAIFMGILIVIIFLLVFHNIKKISKNNKVNKPSKRFENNNQNLFFGIDHINFHFAFSLVIPTASLFLNNEQTSSLALAYSIYSFPHLLFFIIWQQLYLKKITKLILNNKSRIVILIINRIKVRIILPLVIILIFCFSISIPFIFNVFRIEFPNFSYELLILCLSLFPSIYIIYQSTLINSIGKIKIKSIYGIILNLIYFMLLIFVARKYSSIGVVILHSIFIYSRSFIYDMIIYRNYNYNKLH